jgi:hypothetical protein
MFDMIILCTQRVDPLAAAAFICCIIFKREIFQRLAHFFDFDLVSLQMFLITVDQKVLPRIFIECRVM